MLKFTSSKTVIESHEKKVTQHTKVTKGEFNFIETAVNFRKMITAFTTAGTVLNKGAEAPWKELSVVCSMSLV